MGVIVLWAWATVFCPASYGLQDSGPLATAADGPLPDAPQPAAAVPDAVTVKGLPLAILKDQVAICRRKIEMTRGAQSRDDTRRW